MNDALTKHPEQFAVHKNIESTACVLQNNLSFMRQPGIEPGAKQWECFILPLNHWRVARSTNIKFCNYLLKTCLFSEVNFSRQYCHTAFCERCSTDEMRSEEEMWRCVLRLEQAVRGSDRFGDREEESSTFDFYH